MAVIQAEDIVKCEGDVKRALEAKRDAARETFKQTGSYPDWWEVTIHVGKTRGVPLKFVDGDELFSKGYEYFEKCVEKEIRPTKSGLILYLGFVNNGQLEYHMRKHPELREAHAMLMTMLKNTLEISLDKPGGQMGKIFLLKNIPDGFLPTDPVNAPTTYEFQDRKITELTGLNGAPIEVSRKMSPEEGYLKMLEGGRLADDADE